MTREEFDSAGVHILLGTNPDTGNQQAYIGEAEVIRERLKQHKAKALEFWNSIVVFVSKDENLTKAQVRFLENRLRPESKSAGGMPATWKSTRTRSLKRFQLPTTSVLLRPRTVLSPRPARRLTDRSPLTAAPLITIPTVGDPAPPAAAPYAHG